MTTTNTPAYTWHTDVDINGQPYPTRHPVPDYGFRTDAYFGDLTDHARRYLRAVHESAHAVAGLAAGAHVHYANIAASTDPPDLYAAASIADALATGDVYVCNFTNGHDQAVYLGAGERAEDHWLHQNHLWTPTRAVGIELGACGDRRTFLTGNPHFGFGIDHNDYRVVHDLADAMVTSNWDAITAVADVLAVRLNLTGDQIADLAGIPNGTHSDTCTYPA